MRRFHLIAACIGLAAIAQPGPGFAQAQDPAEIVARLEAAAKDDPEMANYLRALRRQVGRQQDQAARTALQQLFEIGPRGDVSAEEIEDYIARRQATRQARVRGNLVGRYLSWDLDGDGAISASERDSFQGSEVAEIMLLFANGDANGDGEIGLEEMLAHAMAETAGKARNSWKRQHQLMLFDLDGNGRVTSAEVLAAIDALADMPPEAAAERPTLPRVTQPAKPACDAPEPAEDADVVVLTGYEGAALATASIAGLDGVTHVARVEIEPGDGPLYVLLAAYSNMIWDISGATDRIATLVVQRSGAVSTPGAGVIGVARDKVHFVDRQTCIEPVSNLKDGEAVLAYRRAAQTLGQEPDVMVATYTMNSVALPSGTGSDAASSQEGRDIIIYDGRRYEFTPDGPREIDEAEGQRPGARPYGADQAHRALLRFNPAGLRTIDPGTVVAPGEAVAYDVLPQQAGLLQLLLEEKLRFSRDGYYVIEQPIARFPAGLNGAHSVKFILAEGVPMPGGSPGHSQVFTAETGECVPGTGCGR